WRNVGGRAQRKAEAPAASDRGLGERAGSLRFRQRLRGHLVTDLAVERGGLRGGLVRIAGEVSAAFPGAACAVGDGVGIGDAEVTELALGGVREAVGGGLLGGEADVHLGGVRGVDGLRALEELV